MTRDSREIFLLIEKTDDKHEGNSHPKKMARNLINKFSISEEDQYEISGLNVYINENYSLNNAVNSQIKRNKEIKRQRDEIFKELKNQSGTVDFFICGMNTLNEYKVSVMSLIKFLVAV